MTLGILHVTSVDLLSGPLSISLFDQKLKPRRESLVRILRLPLIGDLAVVSPLVLRVPAT